MRKLLVLGFVGLLAQLVDGSLGMAYGVTSSTLLLAAGSAGCPNNCTSPTHGLCLQGECFCAQGFTAADCGQRVAQPPPASTSTSNRLRARLGQPEPAALALVELAEAADPAST